MLAQFIISIITNIIITILIIIHPHPNSVILNSIVQFFKNKRVKKKNNFLLE